MSENLNVPNFDPAWDYASVAETLLSLDATRKELGDILSEEQAEVGNLSTDEKILSCILKIEGDCRAIRRAVDAQFVPGTEPSVQMGLQSKDDENIPKATLKCLWDIRAQLLRLSMKISVSEANITEI